MTMIDCRANLVPHEHLAEPHGDWPWHIAVCQPGQDAIAANGLRNRRYRVYRPIVPVPGLDRLKKPVIRWQSMFRGYLFVLPGAQGWEELRTTPGITHPDNALLKVNGRLATIRDGSSEFQLVRATERELSSLQIVEEPRFRPGDTVKIRKGPWINFWARIETLDGEGRIWCLIDMLGRKVRAEVREDQLTAS